MITHHWIVEITYLTYVTGRDSVTETYYFNGSEAEIKEIIENIEKVSVCYVDYYRVSEVHTCRELKGE